MKTINKTTNNILQCTLTFLTVISLEINMSRE